jgi:hypothetical protein
MRRGSEARAIRWASECRQARVGAPGNQAEPESSCGRGRRANDPRTYAGKRHHARWKVGGAQRPAGAWHRAAAFERALAARAPRTMERAAWCRAPFPTPVALKERAPFPAPLSLSQSP